MVHPSSAAAASGLAADDPTLIVASSASLTDRDAPRSTTNANTSDSDSAVHAPSTSSVSVSVSVQVGEVWNPPRSPGGAPASLPSNQPSQNSCSATSSAVDDDTLDVLSTAVTATLATRPSFEPPMSAGMFARVGPPRPGSGLFPGSGFRVPGLSVANHLTAPSFDSPRPYRLSAAPYRSGDMGDPNPPPDPARVASSTSSAKHTTEFGSLSRRAVASDPRRSPQNESIHACASSDIASNDGSNAGTAALSWSGVVGFSNLDPSRRAVSSRARAPSGFLGSRANSSSAGSVSRSRSSPHTNVTRTASADRANPNSEHASAKTLKLCPSGKMLNPAEDDLAGGWTPLAANTENTSAAAAIATTCHRYDTTKSASTRTAASPRSSYARLVACIDAASASTGDWDADDATEAAARDEKSSSSSLQKTPRRS
mmetsp:Transcript_14154/g.59889  ORF Transcript_14154/g.59889 Transcript_14154/m.59889 type:complete len:428 (-) Transcript_14154:194-1477(-)